MTLTGKTLVTWLASSLLLPGHSAPAALAEARATDAGQARVVSLQREFDGLFLIGTALDRKQIMGRSAVSPAFIAGQFNALTPENVMKWEVVQPIEGKFNWLAADRIVEFAAERDMHLTGHTLVWHSQTPDWVFQGKNGGPSSRELLLARMQAHIEAVAGRYKGRVHSWDVVNEALHQDGSLRASKWQQIIGDDYIGKAFEFAHAADPEALLYYNDYGLVEPGKRAGAVRLIRRLLRQGIPVHGIGMQGHYTLDYPGDLRDFERSIVAFSELGVDVVISELDVSVLPFPEDEAYGADISLNVEHAAKYDPYANGLPENVRRALNEKYLGLFRTLMAQHARVSRVTFWGVYDAQSWRNDWPITGRTDYPLAFDRNLQPKPFVFDALELMREQ